MAHSTSTNKNRILPLTTAARPQNTLFCAFLLVSASVVGHCCSPPALLQEGGEGPDEMVAWPSPTLFESEGKLGPFGPFGSDVEAPGVLARAARDIAYRREIILVCGDGSAYASPTALNTVLQFYALGLRHVLYISDSADACTRLRRAVPSLACAWSSVLNRSKPTHGSVLVQKWWDMRFYFYNVRKHVLSRLTSELGYNVLQTDTDAAWFANPYPALKAGALSQHQLVVQTDLPLANAGVLYAQRVASGDATAWVLRELIERIRTFSFHPEVVPRILPWASPPYFSNADEQSLLNDVLASSITQQPCFLFSTAIMEMKYGGTRRNRTFRWDQTPEGTLRPKLMAIVRQRNERTASSVHACGHPQGLQLCIAPRASTRRNVTSFNYQLSSWRLRAPPATAAPRPFTAPPRGSSATDSAVPSDRGPPAVVAVAPPGEHLPPLVPSRYAKAPAWLFQHYSHFDVRDAHKPSPRAASAPAPGSATVLPTTSASRGVPVPYGTFHGPPPVYMVHLAGLRSGAWQRRAVLRGHGWWHAGADALAAHEMRWGRRRGLLLLTSSNLLRPAAGRTAYDAAEVRLLLGNFVLLAALTDRVAVMPEALCDRLGERPEGMRMWRETRRRQQQRRCAWTPPKPCWMLEYSTTLELQRAAAQNATLAHLLRAQRNRTTAAATRRWRPPGTSGREGGAWVPTAHSNSTDHSDAQRILQQQRQLLKEQMNLHVRLRQRLQQTSSPQARQQLLQLLQDQQHLLHQQQHLLQPAVINASTPTTLPSGGATSAPTQVVCDASRGLRRMLAPPVPRSTVAAVTSNAGGGRQLAQKLSARGSPPAAVTHASERLDARTLAKLRALACDDSEVRVSASTPPFHAFPSRRPRPL